MPPSRSASSYSHGRSGGASIKLAPQKHTIAQDMLKYATVVLEDVYGDLLTEIAAILDPEECNPWPHHSTISGASVALTRRIYRQVGRLPLVPLGEDKA